MSHSDAVMGREAVRMLNGALAANESAGGPLSAQEEALKETDSQRAVREGIERRRDNAAEIMRFEHEEMERVYRDLTCTMAERLIAANTFARAMAAYLFARKELELCGWDAGDWPAWYRVILEAIK